MEFEEEGNGKSNGTIKGVSLFEGKVEYHGITPTKDELEIAIKELSGEGRLETVLSRVK